MKGIIYAIILGSVCWAGVWWALEKVDEGLAVEPEFRAVNPTLELIGAGLDIPPQRTITFNDDGTITTVGFDSTDAATAEFLDGIHSRWPEGCRSCCGEPSDE